MRSMKELYEEAKDMLGDDVSEQEIADYAEILHQEEIDVAELNKDLEGDK